MADRDLSANDDFDLDEDGEVEPPPEVENKDVLQDEEEGSRSETNPDNIEHQEDKDS